MDFKKILFATLAVASASQMQAGGYLTNTNQSVTFLRNPARDAAIGIDGVYSNPAGVAFLNDGLHFGVNWQTAIQTRTIDTTSPFLDHTLQATADNAPTKRFRGHATAPILPSLGAAYNKGKWSYQFNFAVSGGGGKCEFDKGIGTFENAVGQIATMLKPLGVKGYSVDNFMEGRQYYFGITLGAAYKVIDNEDLKLSVYGGLRGLIGSASYQARIKDIQVATSDGLLNLGSFLDGQNAYFNQVIGMTKPVYEAYGAQYGAMKEALAGGQLPAETAAQYAQVVGAIEGYMQATGAQQQIAPLEGYRNGLDLTADQTGFGIAPLFSVDLKYKNLNLAAKYEFRTKMNLENSSNLAEATIDATAQFVDGKKVREDSPALLTIGAQYAPIDIVRVNAGYHHFYDRQSKKYADKQNLLKSGTNEYLGGIEVDCTERLTVSCGGQITKYGNTDEYISDVSFATDSWSFGFGASYQANPNVKIEAAYFKTFYEDYKTKTVQGITNVFTRTNDVIGVGLVIDL